MAFVLEKPTLALIWIVKVQEDDKDVVLKRRQCDL